MKYTVFNRKHLGDNLPTISEDGDKVVLSFSQLIDNKEVVQTVIFDTFDTGTMEAYSSDVHYMVTD